MANRFWYQLFGRGIVNPVDDMHADNPPIMPASAGDARRAIPAQPFRREIPGPRHLQQRAYQRSSQAATDERRRRSGPVRPARSACCRPSSCTIRWRRSSASRRRGAFKQKAAKKKGPNQGPRQQFINFFHVDDANPLEYQVGIPQALRLMNSVQLNRTEPAIAAAVRQAGKAAGGRAALPDDGVASADTAGTPTAGRRMSPSTATGRAPMAISCGRC